VARTLGLLLVPAGPLLLAAPAQARSVDTAAATARSATSDTEDGYYCRYSRGLSGAHYYEYVSTHYEWVPVAAIHTGRNVRATFAQGAEMSTSLSGGVTMNGGKTWSVGLSMGATKSYRVNVEMPRLGGGSHKKVLARFKYQKHRLVCYDTDPRSGQVIRRDRTPKYTYTPKAWTTDLKYAATTTRVARCRTARTAIPEQKIRLDHGFRKSVTQTRSFTTTATLNALGVSGSFSSSSGSSKVFTFWTSRGHSFICGDKTNLKDSSRFYANKA
jgi:hypothetical protein